MSEIFNGLLTMFETDPVAFFTTILSYAGITAISGGTLYGVVRAFVKLTNIIFKKDVRLENIVSTNVRPLLNKVDYLEGFIKNKFEEVETNIQDKVSNVLSNVENSVISLENKINAFAEVVLDSEELRLKYEVLQREIINVKQDIIAISKPEPEIDTVSHETPILIETPMEAKKKKIRLKDKA